MVVVVNTAAMTAAASQSDVPRNLMLD